MAKSKADKLQESLNALNLRLGTLLGYDAALQQISRENLTHGRLPSDVINALATLRRHVITELDFVKERKTALLVEIAKLE